MVNKHSNSAYRPGGSHASVVQVAELSGGLPDEWFADGQLNHHLLVLVDSGQARLSGDAAGSVLFPGSCWLLPPGGQVQICSEGEQELGGHAIAFDMWRVAAAVLEPARFPLSGPLAHHLAHEIQLWLDAADHRDEQQELQAFSLSVRFLDLLLKIWQSGSDRRDSQDAREAVQQTLRLMEQCYAQPLTREELAKLANMSASHYSYVFKKEIGKSPMEKLAEIRMRHAKRLLLFSGRKMREIAESVGYRSEFYFSRQFKQVIGVSPKEFARMHYANQIKASHPHPLHLQSLGLTSGSLRHIGGHPHVVGLYVEDFLIALGVQPLLKCVGKSFRQSYLDPYLNRVGEWSLLDFDLDAIADAKPDLIILGHPAYGSSGRFARFSEIAPTYSIRAGLHNWEHGMRIIGQLLNRLPQAESLITHHEQLLRQARERLAAVSGQTVALIRICNDQRIRLYGGPGGYSGIVLYQDLGLTPPPDVLRLAWDKPSGYSPVSADIVYELQADHLFVVVDPAGREYWNRLAGDSRWSRLPSVEAGRCYEVRFDYWMTFGMIAHRLKLQDVLRCLIPPGRELPTIVHK